MDCSDLGNCMQCNVSKSYAHEINFQQIQQEATVYTFHSYFLRKIKVIKLKIFMSKKVPCGQESCFKKQFCLHAIKEMILKEHHYVCLQVAGTKNYNFQLYTYLDLSRKLIMYFFLNNQIPYGFSCGIGLILAVLEYIYVCRYNYKASLHIILCIS